MFGQNSVFCGWNCSELSRAEPWAMVYEGRALPKLHGLLLCRTDKINEWEPGLRRNNKNKEPLLWATKDRKLRRGIVTYILKDTALRKRRLTLRFSYSSFFFFWSLYYPEKFFFSYHYFFQFFDLFSFFISNPINCVNFFFKIWILFFWFCWVFLRLAFIECVGSVVHIDISANRVQIRGL